MAALAAMVSGCGLLTPQARTGARATVTRASHPSRRGQAAGTATRPVKEPLGGEPSQAQAVADFAEVYINWTAGSIARQLTGLALASVGQARSAMSLAAAETRADAQLRAAGIENSGTVEAVAPLLGGSGEWVVVTRERTLASASAAYAGLAPAWHVTVAAVARLASGRWVVSGWQPEN